jgi:hypothetical protein
VRAVPAGVRRLAGSRVREVGGMTFTDCLMAYPNDTAAQSACWAVERCNYIRWFDFSCNWLATLFIIGLALSFALLITILGYQCGWWKGSVASAVDLFSQAPLLHAVDESRTIRSGFFRMG